MSLLYVGFRILMRKETFFLLNRIVLLAVVTCSTIIPLLYLPQIIQPAMPVMMEEIIPVFTENADPATTALPTEGNSQISVTPPVVKSLRPVSLSAYQLIVYVYFAGMLVSLLVLLHGLFTIFLLLRKAQVQQMYGYRLLVINKEIAAFSFGRFVIISQGDYNAHAQSILTHEQAHIRLGHFYDLMLMEAAKLFHWFNPLVYRMVNDLKEIHEFQADDHTLTSGIDATKYQLLIIQKSVGPQRFALANSFNHCQIKNRITMMNKQKTSKAWRWKVATFLPLLALLLMAFGRTGESGPLKVIATTEIIREQQSPLSDLSIEIRNDGNYIDNKLHSLEEIIKRARSWQKTNEEILLVVDNQIPHGRIDEVREALENADIYFVNQKSHDSDEIIYPHGDVTELAKFTQGKWDAWINSQLKNLSEGKSDGWEYKIKMGFIIDKSGKVRGAHLIKGSDNTEINAAFEKLLAQIPDWEPAKKGSKKVSVYYRGIKTTSITSK